MVKTAPFLYQAAASEAVLAHLKKHGVIGHNFVGLTATRDGTIVAFGGGFIIPEHENYAAHALFSGDLAELKRYATAHGFRFIPPME